MPRFQVIHSVTTAKTSVLRLGLLAGVLSVAAAGLFFWHAPRVAGLRSPIIVHPGGSVAAALRAAQPGTTILVKAGTYKGNFTTIHGGTARAPITIKAESGAILQGSGDGRLFTVKHDFYRIEGFEWKEADTLLWLEGASHNVVTKNFFHDAQGECIRAKYHSSHNVFSNNRVENCGREDFVEGGDGKNGEGIYLGTAPEQLDRNHTPERDTTNFNIIRHNRFNTQGNECVDIKEGSEKNMVEYNDCTGQKDPESGGLSARGSRNIFRYNTVHNNVGAGIRLGGDEDTDGVGNEVTRNTLIKNAVTGIKVVRQPQGKICGNTVTGSVFSNTRDVQPKEC